MTKIYVDKQTLQDTFDMLELAIEHINDVSITAQLRKHADDMLALINNPKQTLEKIPQNKETLLQVAAITAVRDYKNTVDDIVTGRFSATSPNESARPKSGIPVIAPEYVPAVFPSMLRKMWSGGEMQGWLDENKCLMIKPAEAV